MNKNLKKYNQTIVAEGKNKLRMLNCMKQYIYYHGNPQLEALLITKHIGSSE